MSVSQDSEKQSRDLAQLRETLAGLRQQLAEKEAELERETNARLHLESQLQVAEESGLSLVENLSEVIYTADTQGIMTYVSPAIERVLGYHPSEMVGQPISEFMHPDDLALLQARVQHVLGGGDTITEYRALTKSGHTRWMRTSSQPVFDGDQITGIQGVLTDTTTRREAEEQIRQQNEFLTDVLESLTHPFYVVDVNDYTIQIANSATGRWERAGAITCHVLTHGQSAPCDTAVHLCPIEEVKKTKQPFTVEHVHYDAGGDLRHFEVHAYPLLDDDGNVVRAIEYTLDVTERKLAEDALRESEENWRSLTEYSPDHILLLDRDATILFANHTLPELSREQVIGTSFFDYALEEYRQVAQECFERVLKTGQADRFESVYVDEEGNPTVFESHVGPVMRAGKVWGLTVRSTDITERRQAEQALQALTYELGERIKELNCLYGISKLFAKPNIALEEILQETLELFPPAFQYPEIICARILLEDKEFRTSSFRATGWRLDTPLMVHGDRLGTLEVYYLEERPERDEGPFLEEDRTLIGAIAEQLGRIVERVRAEQAVRQSEKEYRQLLNALQEGIWVIDQDANTTFVNPRMAEMLGYTVEEMQGQHLYSFMDERGIKITERNLERRAQGIQEQHDFEFLRKDGSRIYTLLETSPIYDDDGNYVGGIAGIQDITDRKLAEKALQESEARWRSFTEYSPDHVVILDTDLNIQFVNYSSPGLTVEELIGTPLHTYVTQDRQAEIKQILTDVLNTGEPRSYETEYITPDGDTIYYESRVAPRMLDKQIVGLAVNARDITEHRQAEEALRQSEKQYRQLLETLQEGIWVIDQDANTTFVNPRMAEMLGYTMEEMQGRNLYSFMDERGVEIARHNLERRAQDTREQHDVEFLRKDGGRIYALLETSPIYDDDGNYVGEISGVQDITDRRQAQEALQESEALLNETQQMARLGGWDLDLGTSQVTWTDEVYRIHEVPPGFQPTLDNALDFYDPHDRPVLEQAIQEATESGEPWDLELRFITATGKRLWVRAIGRAERQNGHVVRLSGTFQDITERKQAEEALQEAAAAAERNRLARDLHDSVTQALFSASLVAEVLPQVWQRDPEIGQQGLEELRLLTRGALAEMRTMLLELRPTALVETNLSDLLWQLTEAITSRAQLDVKFDIEPIPPLPPDVHVTLYRVAQEALHNVVKHADASQVTVSLRGSPPVPDNEAAGWQGQVILHISDDGQGIDHSRSQPGQLGLGIMRERADAIGAVLTIEGKPDQGTRVTLVWTNP